MPIPMDTTLPYDGGWNPWAVCLPPLYQPDPRNFIAYRLPRVLPFEIPEETRMRDLAVNEGVAA